MGAKGFSRPWTKGRGFCQRLLSQRRAVGTFPHQHLDPTQGQGSLFEEQGPLAGKPHHQPIRDALP